MAIFLTIYKVFSIKIGLGVVQDHWKWRHSIDHIWLSIGLPL